MIFGRRCRVPGLIIATHRTQGKSVHFWTFVTLWVDHVAKSRSDVVVEMARLLAAVIPNPASLPAEGLLNAIEENALLDLLVFRQCLVNAL